MLRSSGAGVAQARPTLHATLMQRMTFVLSRMLNDPATRAALSGGGEDALQGAATAATAAAATQRQADREAEAGQQPEAMRPGPVAAETEAAAAAERRRSRSKRAATERRRSSSSSSSTPPGSATSKRLLSEGQDDDSCDTQLDMMASSSGLHRPGDTSSSARYDHRRYDTVEIKNVLLMDF